jgi:hypothetical protein
MNIYGAYITTPEDIAQRDALIATLTRERDEARNERDECFAMICKLMPLDVPTDADIEWARKQIVALPPLDAKAPEAGA